MIGQPVVQVWDATGSTPLGVLGELTSLTVSDTLSDIGSLRLVTTLNAAGVDVLIDEDHDRQLRLVQPGAPDLWFLVDEDSTTYVSDDPASEAVEVTCRSLAAVLDEAVVVPILGFGSGTTEWPFVAATPGKIVADLVASAQARGLCQGVTLAGDATVDATGIAWPDPVTITYKTGATLLSVLSGLAKNLLLEWRMNGRVLELHAPGGGLDRTLTRALRPGVDVISAPLVRSRRSVATAAVVEGQSASTERRTQTILGRRAREVYVSQTSAPPGALAVIGDLYLSAHDTIDAQISHDLTGDVADTLLPWVDYRPGDRIPTAAAGPGVALRRVQQVSVTWSDERTTAALELGSVLDDATLRMSRSLKRLLPGVDSL
jgi:hypothetical protein